jgi:hypothetical protein
MNVTVAHRHRPHVPHVHVPRELVIAVLIVAVLSAVIIVLVNEPWSATPTGASSVEAGSAATATWPELRAMGRGIAAQAEAGRQQDEGVIRIDSSSLNA